MLDANRERKADTAATLKARLAAAFVAWQRLDPAQHTKAKLAREASQMAGKPCSAQTVSGWFSTGRMDKSWLPIVETVLGSSLGFGVAGSASSDGLSDVERRLIEAFRKLGAHQQDEVRRQLQRMLADIHAEIGATLQQLGPEGRSDNPDRPIKGVLARPLASAPVAAERDAASAEVKTPRRRSPSSRVPPRGTTP